MPKTAKVLTFRIVIPKIVAAIAVTMLLSVSQPLLLTAASYGVKSLSVDDGLSQSMAYCILQDSRGFIWIGTQDGLNRYDGKTVKTYRHDPNLPGSPGSDRYFSIWQDSASRLWFGTQDGISIYNPELDRFSHFDSSEFAVSSSGTTVSGVSAHESVEVNFCVRHISGDDEGNVWIAGDGASLMRFDRNSGTLSDFSLRDWADSCGLDPNALSVRDVVSDTRGLYLATIGAGLLRLNIEDRSVTVFSPVGGGSLNETTCIIPYMQDCLLVGTASRGVLSFDRHTGKFSGFFPEGSRKAVSNGVFRQHGASGTVAGSLYVRCLLKASDGRVWIGTESGVHVLDPRDHSVETWRHAYGDPYSLSDNAVHSIAEDRDGGIWVGTYFGGVNYFAKSNWFRRYYPIPGENAISGRCISEFCEDGHGSLWIATEDAGLNRLDLATGIFTSGAVPASNVHALLSDGESLWVGTFSEGLYLLNLRTGSRKHYKTTDQIGSLPSNDVYSVFRDSYGTLWIGTYSGLVSHDPASDRFVSINREHIISQVNDIKEDWRGVLWFATIGDGVWSYDRDSDRWTGYGQPSSGSSASLLKATCLTLDRSGRVWAGTDGDGVFAYDKETDSFVKRFSSRNGLLNDVIYSMVTDRSGALWGSTDKGLFRIEPESLAVTCYTKDNGLLCDQFNFKSGYMDSDGRLYFGGISGFVSFSPEDLPKSFSRGSLLLSSLYVNNREVRVDDPELPLLEKSITDTKELVIPPSISTFSLGVTEINYSPSMNRTWWYRLDDWDRMWMPLSLPDRITYSNLPYGSYRLRVRESGDDGAEDLITLRIVIRPPFWRSGWAWMIYLLLLSGLIAFAVWFVRQRMRTAEERRQAKINEEKDREIYEAKLGFFSNITHEIRTPLSLIKLPLNEIIEKTLTTAPEYRNLLTIRDNTDRLLNLVNQLLDFRKVSSQNHDPVFVRSDLSQIIGSVISRFTPSAKIKGITIDPHVPEGFRADVDVEMFVKMTSNLMNNALKHARTRIVVDLLIDDNAQDFLLTVANDGDRIPQELSDEIFTPFFKVEKSSDGFGVGLSLVKMLAELHGGSVRFYENSEPLTCFELCMPVVHAGSFNLDRSREREIEVETRSSWDDSLLDSDKKVILMVDDDVEFLDYISRLLESKFRVIRATNGSQAWDLLEKRSINMIISDIVMPEMDGRTLCTRVKSDLRFRHIPVILLSSETAAPASKSDAYACGADQIVDKPFYYEYLIACISNLLKANYISEAAKFTAEENSDSLVFTKADDGFMNMLIEMIESHIEDVDLDINKLASMMNMSRATLYRKTSEVLRVTPNDFIRTIRLKKAAELLRQKEYRVNEIAYIVGFSSSSYFSKCFYKHFGVLPKDFK